MLPPLSTLPKDNRIYRIDSIGNLQRNPSSSANHIMSVSLSEISGENTNQYSPLMSSSDKSNRSTYYISIGEFFSHCAGSLIGNGKLLSVPTQSNFESRLTISDNSTRLISSTHREIHNDKAEFVIPQAYRFGANGALPNLVAIARDGDPYSVLVPTNEIVRFYHCGSSTLSQALFTSQITDLNSFANLEKTQFDQENRRLSIVLRKQFPDDDAIIIGRWITDSYAHSQSMAMWNALVSLRYSERFHLGSPKDAFPFKGDTTIRAYGVYLPTPTNVLNQRFLVLSLLHCSYPLPFDELIIDSERPRFAGVQTDEAQEHEEKQNSSRYKRRPKTVPETTSDPFLNPSSYFDAAIIKVPSNRFPIIKIVRQEGEVSRQGPHQPQQERPLTGQSTSNEVSEENGTQRLNIVPGEIQGDPDDQSIHDFNTFNEICEALKKHSKSVHELTSVQLRPASHSSEADVSCFDTPSRKRGSSWFYVAEQNNEARPRRYMLKKLVTTRGTQYLLYIERRTSPENTKIDEAFAIYVFSHFNHIVVSNDLLMMLMNELATTKLVGYVATFASFNFYVSPKKHTGDIERIAMGILTKIQQNKWSAFPTKSIMGRK